jgi:hypothetical protein
MLRNPISGFDKVGKSSAAESDGGIRGKDESKLLGFRTDERTMLTRASAFASTLEAVRSHFKEVDRWSFSVDDGGRSFRRTRKNWERAWGTSVEMRSCPSKGPAF